MKKIIIIISLISLLLLSGCSQDIDYLDLYCKDKGFKGYISDFTGYTCYNGTSQKFNVNRDDFYTWQSIYLKEIGDN